MSDLSASDRAALRDGTIDDAALDRIVAADVPVPELEDVRTALVTAGAPPMPASVAARLAAVVGAESERRTSGRADAEAEARRRHAAKQQLGTFENNPPAKQAALRPNHQHH